MKLTLHIKYFENVDDEEHNYFYFQHCPFFHICCRKKYNEQGCKNNYHLENNSDKDKKEFEKERNKDHWEEVLRSLII